MQTDREFENIEEAIKVVKSNVLAYECKDDKTNKKEQKKARKIIKGKIFK